MERGIIKNSNFAKQIIKFEGLKFGSITPTDIDAFIDFNNKLFIFIEVKHKHSLLPEGQRLSYERLVDGYHNPPRKFATCIVEIHETEGDIDLKSLCVRGYRWENHWIKPEKLITVKELIDDFRMKYLDNKTIEKNVNPVSILENKIVMATDINF